MDDPKEFDDPQVFADPKAISNGSILPYMDFDNTKVYGDTTIPVPFHSNSILCQAWQLLSFTIALVKIHMH